MVSILIAAMVTAGVVLIWRGWAGLPVLPVRGPGVRRHRWRGRWSARHIAVLVVAAGVVLVVTGWPVAAAAAAVLVAAWAPLFSDAQKSVGSMEKLEALTVWTEAMRDDISGAAGLYTTLRKTTVGSSSILRPHLDALEVKLRSNLAMTDALRDLADDLDDASADEVVAALILNADAHGPALKLVLTDLADTFRKDLEAQRDVESERRKQRTTVRMSMGAVVMTVGFLMVFSRSFLEPYSSLGGQVVLMIVLGLIGSAFWWLHQLSAPAPQMRLLSKTPVSS